jgi:hypothetical protein
VLLAGSEPWQPDSRPTAAVPLLEEAPTAAVVPWPEETPTAGSTTPGAEEKRRWVVWRWRGQLDVEEARRRCWWRGMSRGGGGSSVAEGKGTARGGEKRWQR